MLHVSDILGKQVISLYESELIGTINNIFFNKTRTKVSCYEIITLDGEREYVNVSDIYSVNQIVCIKTKENLILESELDKNTLTENFINKQIFTPSGLYEGNVADIVLTNYKQPNYLLICKDTNLLNEYTALTSDNNNSDKEQDITGNSDKIITSVSFQKIIRTGNVLIMQENDKKIKFSNFKPQIITRPKIEEQTVVALADFFKNEFGIENDVLKDNSNSTKTPPLTSGTKKQIYINKHNENNFRKTASITPSLVLSNNYSFLLNRIATKNILTENNEIIIRKNTKIKQDHIILANSQNKLRELAVFSR